MRTKGISRRCLGIASATLALLSLACGTDPPHVAPPSHFISGTVSGQVKAGVVLSLTGTSTGSATTDSSGVYLFSGLGPGSYEITPSAQGGYAFSPPSLVVSVSHVDLTGQAFSSLGAYGISGIVADARNFSLSGASLEMTGTNRVTKTDSSGFYSFLNLPNGIYTIVPSLSSFSFSPATVTVNGARVTKQNFVGSRTYAISGSIDGGPIRVNVLVSLSGASVASTRTDISGDYFFAGLSTGAYTVIPSQPGEYYFLPASLSVMVDGADVPNQDFSGTTGYSISGSVFGIAASGVTIALSGPVSGDTTTDSAGHYLFSHLPYGNYTLTPSLSGGYVFSPATMPVTLVDSSEPGENFDVAGAHRISGTIGTVVNQGVLIALSGPVNDSMMTGAGGGFWFDGLPNGQYSLAPSVAGGYSFTPARLSVMLDAKDVTGLRFADQGSFTISGSISGLVQTGVTLSLSGAARASTTSAGPGSYSFPQLANGTYSISASSGDCHFTPSSITVVVDGAGVGGQDFSDVEGFGISGTVSGAVRQGVTVTLTGSNGGSTAITDAAGSFSFHGLLSGAYSLTPTILGGYSFSPGSLRVVVDSASVFGQDFSDTGRYGISGMTSSSGIHLPGVAVTLDGSRTAISDSFGVYRFENVPDGVYRVEASLSPYAFGPPYRSVSVDEAESVQQDFATCGAVTPTGSTAVAYQINPAHTGAQPGDTLSLPLCQRWSRDLGAQVSFALVADGRVFVVIGQTAASTASLVALDERSGETLWGPVPLGGLFPRAGAAYDNGRVFALNDVGVLSAFDATSGSILWRGQTGTQWSFDSPPTASDGTVFLAGAGWGGTFYAVDELDGGVAWTAPLEVGNSSSPATDEHGVYVSYSCQQDYGFTVLGGALFHDFGPCEGGGGDTVAVSGGAVYTRDNLGDLILDSATGALRGAYSSKFIPAFSTSAGVALYTPSGLQAVQPDGGISWTFGDDATSINTAPIVVGSQVVVSSAVGQIYVLDAATGAVMSSIPLANIVGTDEQNQYGPLAGLTAADGMLFVPAGTSLVAY